MTELKVFDAVKKIKFKRAGFYAQDANMMIHRFKNTPTFSNGVWIDNLSTEKNTLAFHIFVMTTLKQSFLAIVTR